MDLEKKLEEKGLRLAIKVESVAGLLEGTSSFFLRVFRRFQWLGISPEVCKEFPYQSECSHQLLASVRKIQNTARQHFSFHMYASSEDSVVCPYGSSLPYLGLGETRCVVHREGHCSLLRRVWPMILNSNQQWLDSLKCS